LQDLVFWRRSVLWRFLRYKLHGVTSLNMLVFSTNYTVSRPWIS